MSDRFNKMGTMIRSGACRVRVFRILCVMTLLAAGVAGAAEKSWRPPEKWRGFNLLGLFSKEWRNAGYQEREFKAIHDLGFNFVRLPMDYRIWIKGDDWDQIDEEKIKLVDQAVAWGKQYGIHVQLCFHRAPGYTVAKPSEARDLFTDPEAQRVCCKHWAFFAKRYKGIPNEAMSFNLFNEPDDRPDELYTKVCERLIEAIHHEDPDRFIVADGLKWGGKPCVGLFKYKGLVGQAMRGYQPFGLTHYKASWVTGTDADPQWPPLPSVSPFYGPTKKPWDVPFVVEDAPAGAWILQVGTVSSLAHFVVEADGVTVAEKVFQPGFKPGWTNVVYHPEWRCHQGRTLEPLTFTLAEAADRLTIRIKEGDWAEVMKLTVKDGNRSAFMPFTSAWGSTNAPVRFTGWTANPAGFAMQNAETGIAYLTRTMLDPWKPARDARVFTMVGEFGSHNRTPHPMVLAWLEDLFTTLKKEDLSWALWNFNGSFGITDSGRSDVNYEPYEGFKLDRKMLEVLQRN
ncbi:MAG: cellulase family glycosylhydrolase [Kiritimatiellae bacterium]|nr:cellulase family glycosylhydrolase [Kiritimatiellia bacterium]